MDALERDARAGQLNQRDLIRVNNYTRLLIVDMIDMERKAIIRDCERRIRTRQRYRE